MVRAEIHGSHTMIIAFHADNHSDTEQEASYHELMKQIPYDKECKYIWMYDGNNLPNPKIDAKRSDGKPTEQNRPKGVTAANACATKWGGLSDAYRTKNKKPQSQKDYTRRATIKKNAESGNIEIETWRRIDRISVTTNTLGDTVPKVHTIEHILPTSEHRGTTTVAVRTEGSKTCCGVTTPQCNSPCDTQTPPDRKENGLFRHTY